MRSSLVEGRDRLRTKAIFWLKRLVFSTRHLLDEAGDHLRENAIFSLKRVTFRCLPVAAYDNFSALASDPGSVMFA